MLPIRMLLACIFVVVMGWVFLSYDGWMELCAGLALFIFGMECLEAGLKKLTGTGFEKLLTKSTSTPMRGLLFGVASTAVLQSSTLVSLLTIAFISSGLIQLAGGIAILFGANLGATTGIWLLAIAGKGVSLAPMALPILVFGMVMGFVGDERAKGIGRLLLGIAFIFLSIDLIKQGFDSLGDGADFSSVALSGVAAILLFVLLGTISSVILQSSHATLMLVLTALAGGQLDFEQSLAIVIGSNIGSSVSTAAMGILGGNRSGQRLALAHVIFNVVTAIVALILLNPFYILVEAISGLIGFSNDLLKLALFHTLFNLMGVILFWPWQVKFVNVLNKLLPEKSDDCSIHAMEKIKTTHSPLRALYLTNQSLESIDAVSAAISLELKRLGHLTISVIGKIIYVSDSQLQTDIANKPSLLVEEKELYFDADSLYQENIKGIYSDLLDYLGKINFKLDDDHKVFFNRAHVISMKMVEAVKSAKHLQKNLKKFIDSQDQLIRDFYLDIRFYLFKEIRFLLNMGINLTNVKEIDKIIYEFDLRRNAFICESRERLFELIRDNKINGLNASSLMNDISYAEKISECIKEIVNFVTYKSVIKN